MDNNNTLNFGAPGEKKEEASDKLTIKQKIQIRQRRIHPMRWFTSLVLFILLFAGVIVTSILRADTKVPSAETVARDPDTTVIDFVGDVMLGRNIMDLGDYSGYDKFFAGVTDYWKNDDLAFANLESAVLNDEPSKYDGSSAYGNILLYAKYAAVDAAINAGLTAFSCANNHFFDYGDRATVEFIDYLEKNNLIYSGIGRDITDAAKYRIIEINGMKIAYVAIDDVYYLDEVARDNKPGVLATAYGDYTMLVYNAAQEADLTIVYMHWGIENDYNANKDQTRIGHMLIDAGADIVIGAHPHVLQSVERYHDGIIFYSLGNFIFDQGSTFSKDTVMLRLTLDKNGNGSFKVIPFRINDCVPSETENGYYKSRIYGNITNGLSEEYFRYDENGYLIIPFDISIESEIK